MPGVLRELAEHTLNVDPKYKPAEKLLDRFILRINIEGVLSEFSRYTRHVRRLQCKDVPILTDELDERFPISDPS